MKTYKYQPEKKSRIFDSSLKASNQLPLSTILLKYGEKMEGSGSRNRIPITNGVIQKELSNDFDKNHLNVAGETHHEVVRGAECELLSQYGFSPDFYYEEHELAVDGRKIKRPEDIPFLNRPSADPTILRTLQIISFIQKCLWKIENYEKIKNSLRTACERAEDKWRLFEIAQKKEELDIKLGKNVLKLNEYISRALPFFLNHCKELFERKEEVRDVDKGNLSIIIKLISYVKEYNMSNSMQELIRKSIYIQEQLLAVTTIDLSQFTSLDGHFSSQIQASRSYHMHETANQLNGRGIKGLWKIGNSHVLDIIRNKKPEEINYNLILEDDFKRILLKHKLGYLLYSKFY